MAQDYAALAQQFGGQPAAAKKPAGTPLPGGGMIISDPSAIRELQLREGAAARDEAALALRMREAEGGNVPTGYRRSAAGGLEPIPGGPADLAAKIKPLREGDAQKLTDDVQQLDALKRAVNTFQDDFAGNLLGDVENMAQGITGMGTPGQRDWWADFRATDNVIRNSLFGASLTAGEKSAYAATTITPRMSPDEIRKNLQRRTEIIDAATKRRVERLRAGGYNPGEIDAIAGPVLEQPVEAGPQAGPDGRMVSAPPGTAPGIVMGAMQSGEPVMSDKDLADRRALQQAWDSSGGDPEAVRAAAQSVGRAITPELDKFMRENTGRNVVLQVTPTGTPTAAEAAVGEFVATPVGETVAAGALANANATTFGLLDELAPLLNLDPDRVQMAKRYLQERNVTATLAGETLGSILPGGAVSKGVNTMLDGTRFAGATPLAGDTIAGLLAGAGEANENRLGGALFGGAFGAGAGAAGRRVFGDGAPPSGGPDAGMPPAAPMGGPSGGRASGGAAATPDDVIRVSRANELPVPVPLANFQKTRKFEDMQRARELAKNNEVGGPIRERMAQQQQAIAANFDAFIDETGAQVLGNLEEQGARITAGIRSMADKSKAKYRALYKRAQTAGETREPVSYQPVLDAIAAKLPTEQDEKVLRIAREAIERNDPNNTGQLSIEAMEAVRKAVGSNMATDANQARLGGEVKGIIDSILDDAGGDVYRSARAAFREHQATFKDVGIIAQLLGTKRNSTDRVVAAENVVARILAPGTEAAQLRKMRDLVTSEGGDPQAWAEVQGAVAEQIRRAAYPAGAAKDEAGQVAVSPAGLKRIIDKLDAGGKLNVIFDGSTAQGFRTLSDVAQDVFTAPPGSVNFSNTTSAWENALDRVLNTLVTGLPVSGGVMNNIVAPLRKRIKERPLQKEVQQLIGEPTQ